MVKRTPAWQEFETVVAEIQAQLAPQADVKHNHKVRGKSGRLRQLDVTVTQKIGLVPVMIVFECKHFGRVVGIEKVESFVQKLLDVGASSGVIISVHGFDAGAKAIAERNNVMLLTCREAEETDWLKVVGVDAWLTYTVRFYEYQGAGVQFRNRSLVVPEIPLDTMIYVQGESPGYPYEELTSVHKLFVEQIPQTMPPVLLGRFEAFIVAENPLYACIGEGWQEIERIDTIVIVTATAYFLNLPIAYGKVLEGVGDTDTEYIHAVSEGFDWLELVTKQPGKMLTPEEYKQILDAPGLKLTVNDGHNLQRYLRVVLTHTKK